MTELPNYGRLVGIDYGLVRIGIAITDPGQTLASPYEIYTVRDSARDGRYFLELCKQERVAGFVVGLPVNLNGSDSQISVRAEEFAKWLGDLTGLPCLLFDERFTSAFADEIIREAGLTRAKRKQLIDKLAAQILLNSFLESHRQAPGRSDRDRNESRGLDDH